MTTSKGVSRPHFTLKEIRYVGDALWTKCLSELGGFTQAAKILRKMGSEQEATIFEERRDLLKGMKTVTLAEIAKRPNSEFFFRKKAQ